MERNGEEGSGVGVKAFSDIVGQEDAVRFLRQVITGKKIPHAYLFTGIAGVGKTTTALAFGRALNCLDPREGDGCGRCVSCRQMAGGNFPDLEILEPIGKSIRIEQIRELIRRIGLKTVSGRYRLTVIERAEAMGVEAANAFLKTLEEPPSGNILILNATDQRDLLPTILSRCQKVSFHPVSPDLTARWLCETAGIAGERAAVLARLSEGSLGRALRMAQSEDFGDRYASHVRALAGLPDLSKAEILDLAVRYAREGRKGGGREPEGVEGGLQGVLGLWKTCLRDMLIMRTGKLTDLLIHADNEGELKKTSRGFTISGLVEGLLILDRAQRDLQRARNQELVMETTLLSLKDLAGGAGRTPACASR